MAPLRGSDWCFAHDPSCGREWARVRKQGGHNRRVTKASRSSEEPVLLRLSAVWFEFLDAAVPKVDDEHRTIGTYRNIRRPIELLGPDSGRTEACEERAIGREFLNPMVEKVGNENLATRADSNTCCDIKPAVEAAWDVDGERPSPSAEETAVRVKELQTIVVRVSDQ